MPGCRSSAGPGLVLTFPFPSALCLYLCQLTARSWRGVIRQQETLQGQAQGQTEFCMSTDLTSTSDFRSTGVTENEAQDSIRVGGGATGRQS